MAIFAIAAIVVGAIAAAWGYRRRGYHQVIAGTPTSRVLDVDQPGTVELTGTVRPTDDGPETLTPPLSGEDCLVAGWEIEEWDQSGKHSSWDRVAQGYDSVPFVLDDGSAEVRVEPGMDASSSGLLGGIAFGDLQHSVNVDDVTVDFDQLPPQHQVAPSDEKPAEIEHFEQNTPGVSEQTGAMLEALDLGRAHGERKYYESTIEADDEVYLLGTVEPKDDDRSHTNRRLRPEDAVVTPGGESSFILSSRSEEELLDKTGRGTVTMALGLLVVAVGFGSLLIPGLL